MKQTKIQPEIQPERKFVFLQSLEWYSNNFKTFQSEKLWVINKKEQKPSVAKKVVSTASIPEKEKKVFYSDNQLLFEHVIELNAKVDKLMAKHKKLKRRYQTLQNDIYAEDDEVTVPQTIKEPETHNEQVNEPVHEPVHEQQIYEQQIQQPVYNKRMNWRTKLTYL